MASKRPTQREINSKRRGRMGRGTTKRPTLTEMKRGKGLKLAGQGLGLAGRGLTPKEKLMLTKVKVLILKKQQSGSGLSTIIDSIVKLVEKLGFPLTPILWNKFIFPIISKTLLRGVDPSTVRSIREFLKMGGGLGLAGGRHKRRRKKKVGRPRKVGGRHKAGRPRKVGRPRRKRNKRRL